MGDRSRKLGTWSTLQSLQAARKLGFQAIRLVETSSKQLGWFLLLSDTGQVSMSSLQHGLDSLGGRGLVNRISFRDFLLNCLLPARGASTQGRRKLLHNTGSFKNDRPAH